MKKTIILFSLTLLFTTTAWSSLYKLVTTTQMAQRANAIRVGKVTKKFSSWDPQNKMIYTYVEIEVSQTLKGEKQKKVLIRQPGGQLKLKQADGFHKGIGMVVHGVANFEKGENVFLFENYRKDGAGTVSFQEKRKLVKDPKTKKIMATMETPENVELVEEDAEGHYREATHSQAAKRQSLDDLIQEVTQALSKPTGAQR